MIKSAVVSIVGSAALGRKRDYHASQDFARPFPLKGGTTNLLQHLGGVGVSVYVILSAGFADCEGKP
jgi:hypothetical protein